MMATKNAAHRPALHKFHVKTGIGDEIPSATFFTRNLSENRFLHPEIMVLARQNEDDALPSPK